MENQCQFDMTVISIVTLHAKCIHFACEVYPLCMRSVFTLHAKCIVERNT